MRFGRILLVRRSNLDRKIDGSVSALRADAVQTRSSRKARIVIRHHQDKLLIFLVRTAGLEPARGCPQGILSPLRLPFRHVRKEGKEYRRPQADKGFVAPRHPCPLLLVHPSPHALPVLAIGIGDAAVALEELVWELEHREHHAALGRPGDVPAPRRAPHELAGAD